MADQYEIRYMREAVEDMRPLRAFGRSRIVEGVSPHLSREPTRLGKSRIKQMTQPFWSQYRLRIDEFRIYYDVDEAGHAVDVLRVLRKGSGLTPTESP